MNNPALPHAKTLSPIPVIPVPSGKGKEKILPMKIRVTH